MVKINKSDFFNEKSEKLLKDSNEQIKQYLFELSLKNENASEEWLEFQENMRLLLDVNRLTSLKFYRTEGKFKKSIKASHFCTGHYEIFNEELHLFFKVEPNFQLKKFNPNISVLSLQSNLAYFGSNIRFVLSGEVDAAISLTNEDEEALDLISKGKFYIHICRNFDYVSTLYELVDTDLLKKWQKQITEFFQFKPLLENKFAAKYLMARNRSFATKDELLRVGWVDFLKGGLFEIFENSFIDHRYSKEFREKDKTLLKQLASKARLIINTHEKDELKNFILPLITEGSQTKFINELTKLIKDQDYEKLLNYFVLVGRVADDCGYVLVREIYKCMNAIISFQLSSNGSKFNYFNLPNILNEIDIEENFQSEKNFTFFVEEFWKSFGYLPPVDLNYWHSENSLPICEYQTSERDIKQNIEDQTNKNLLPHESCLKNISLESDEELTNQVIQELMDESVANKEWTIPPAAFCDVQIGKFNGITLTEIRDRVYFKLHYGENLYLNGYAEPSNRSWWINPHAFNYAEGIKTEEVVNAILLIVVSFIRDFWVIEERESKFQQKTSKGSKTKTKKSNIIYLPRVRYLNSVSPKHLRKEIDLQARAKHTVRAHLRKSQYSSEAQNALARHYNFEIPVGFTFVRPHERGNSEAKKLYRSKSASAILGQEFRSIEGKPVDWFKFERDVANYMAAKGFQVIHRTVHRGSEGDGGIDVLANKVAKDGIENWLIQCKAEKKPSGPSVIRDLLGANVIYGGDNLLMVVSLSGFTSGALNLAEDQGVVLVDGNSFAEEVLK